jgi:hypothetical protein
MYVTYSSKHQFSPNLVCSFIEIGKGQNSENVLSWFSVSARAVSVARKLSKMEVRRQDQVVSFSDEITETMATTLRNCPAAPVLKLLVSTSTLQEHTVPPDKLSRLRVPVKMVCVARKLDRIEERRQEQSCFEYEIAGTKGKTPKSCPWFASQWRCFM